MKLSKEQLKQVQEAILSGYDEPSLRMMVRVELGENLVDIAGGDALTLRVRVFNLIDWAERRDRIFELIDGARAQMGSNADIQRVWQASQQWRQPTGGAPGVKPPIDFDWVTVRAGSFLMGDKEELCGGRQDSIYVPALKIARVPVTNAQYEQFVDATGHATPEHWQHGRIPAGKENHPVVNVTWYDATAFCKWAGVCLPTEAQWEKAARGTDGRKYPWGNEAPTKDLCNFGGNVGDTTPVGKHPKGASPYGVLDMAGNVWEWTSSLYKPYPYDASDGRESPEGGEWRGLRGGSWRVNPDGAAAAIRSWNDPVRISVSLGFRVVVCSSPS